jgi:16S rRNA U516 pseudouridylate synthase RsuA-like enzyme
MDNIQDKELRLQVFMSRSGVASRRNCEKLIPDGFVIEKLSQKWVIEFQMRILSLIRDR